MFPEFLKQKTTISVYLPQMENEKWQTSVCMLQTETENESLFSLVGE
jgi:hypothetical protein